MLAEAGRAGARTVSISNNPTSPLAELADLSIVTSVYEQFLQPDDLSAKHGQLLVLDVLYLLVAQQNFDRSSAKLAASAMAVSSHRRPRRHAYAGRPTRAWRRARAGICPDEEASMITTGNFSALVGEYADQVRSRLDALAEMAAAGGLDAAVDLLTRAIEAGAVIQAFGTGHSEAFAMEIAGRAGGLIPTNKIALRRRRRSAAAGPLGQPGRGVALERDPAVVEELWDISPIGPGRRLRHRLQLRRQRLDRRHGAAWPRSTATQ